MRGSYCKHVDAMTVPVPVPNYRNWELGKEGAKPKRSGSGSGVPHPAGRLHCSYPCRTRGRAGSE